LVSRGEFSLPWALASTIQLIIVMIIVNTIKIITLAGFTVFSFSL